MQMMYLRLSLLLLYYLHDITTSETEPVVLKISKFDKELNRNLVVEGKQEVWYGQKHKLHHQDQLFPFKNTSLPFDERVDDLVSRLTLDELVLQLSRGGVKKNGPAPAISRLGIKPYQWDTECLHGYLAAQNEATCFPQAIGLAATFSKPLVHTMARAVALEARASHENFNKKSYYGDHTGLSCFAPVINIMRHPLWGRNQETYGEDPVLTGSLAEAYVTGLRGHHKVAAATATCKHFGVHAGPENIPVSRFSFNANVSMHDLGTTFLPAFRKCVGAGADGVMCSYNAINGVPACANHLMIEEILRGKFGFEGYVVSDENAVENIDLCFHYTKDANQTALASKQAGVDLELTAYGPHNRFSLLDALVRNGSVSNSSLVKSAKRLFRTRMRLGEFDPPDSLPWFNLSMDVVQSARHRRLAEDIATKSFVLLKNDGTLPLPVKHFDNVSMVGPFLNNSVALSGDYAPIYFARHFSPPRAAAAEFAVNSSAVRTSVVCVGAVDQWLPRCGEYDSSLVKDAVSDAQLVFVTLGTGRGVEEENNDRSDLQLPGKQLDLLQDVVTYAPTSAKVVLLLFNAGPLDVAWAVASPRINAILACHFPAQATGAALQRILSGADNPAGRLPNTWPASLDQVPPITDYSMKERTYRYQTTQPLFPFGYGLSYTRFAYKSVHLWPREVTHACRDVFVRVEVENVGKRHGDEVIQVYMKWMTSSTPTPIRQLVGFERVHVRAGERVTRHVKLDAATRAVWKDGRRGHDYYLEAGKFKLYVGGQQPHQAVRVPSNVVEEYFRVDAREQLLSDCERRHAGDDVTSRWPDDEDFFKVD